MNELVDYCNEYRQLCEQCGTPGGEKRVAFYGQHKRNLNKHAANNPDVSIVVPAHNEQTLLPRFLGSLDAACATLPKNVGVEVVIVNNLSTDATAEIAQEFGVNLVNEDRKGISFARQAGLLASSGGTEALLTADSDSVVPEYWITKYLSVFSNKPDVVMAFGEAKPIIDTKLSLRKMIEFYLYKACEWPYRKIRQMDSYVVPASNNMAFKRDEAMAVGGYDTNLARGEDYDLYKKLKERGEVMRIHDFEVIVSGRRIYKEDLAEKVCKGIYQMSKFLFKHEGMTGYKYADYRTEA